jgi:DNA gyrase subunit A
MPAFVPCTVLLGAEFTGSLVYYNLAMTDTNIVPVNVTDQMKEDYGAYAMAVLLGRAVPDLYDGLKPAQRRILQTMAEENLKPEGRFVKCARVTGLTLAFYHPQGGCYGTLVGMATPWNNNVPWIDGHGNFGSSVDGPAAERYTECKLRPSAVDILLRNRETWETRPNYDGTKSEAVRFNTAIPSILLNGDAGIAVGFATRLAPHGLRSIVEATKLACKPGAKPSDITKARELLVPDFPTGCDVIQDASLDEYKLTGSGPIRCRAKVETGLQRREGRAKDRETLVFTHLPPHTNPEKIGEEIKDALERGRIEGVAEIVDESDLTGDRIVVIAKPGVQAKLLAKQVFAATSLDSKYSTKTLVIDGKKPVELSPIEICQRWFVWRMERTGIQFKHELDLTEQRLEIVMGFLKALDKIDAVIKTIRASSSKKEALIALVDRPFKFTRDQADAILEMRLRQLTGLDQSELEAEKAELEAKVKTLDELTSNDAVRQNWIYKQMDELAKRHGNARQSQLIATPEVYAAAKIEKSSSEPRASRPRFLIIDSKKGLVSQAKGPRGAMVIDQKEKFISITEDGLLRKLPAHFKGPLSLAYSPVVLAKRETEVEARIFLVVFRLDGKLRAMTLNGRDLCRTTSTGKRLLPEGSELMHFGEGSFKVEWKSPRKNPLTLDLKTKAGHPGAKGITVASINDLKL